MNAIEHLARVRGWLKARGWQNLPEDWADYEETEHGLLITNVPQNSAEWRFLRCGIITTSFANVIMTPTTRELSEGRWSLAARLIGEELLGEPYDWGKTDWTDRGHEYEPNARAWYQAERGLSARQVGFILADDGLEGGSPDALVDDDGGLEIKCLGLDQHMRVLMGTDPFPANPGQVQALMRITGRQWWDCVAYHPSPKIPNRLERVRRDDLYIKQYDDCVRTLKREMAKARERLAAYGSARVDSTDLLSLLAASISRKRKAAFSRDELLELEADMAAASDTGLLVDDEVAEIGSWLQAGEFEAVRLKWSVFKAETPK